MWSRVKKFIAMPGYRKALLFEAYIYLAWARLLKLMPFAKIAPTLGVKMTETSYSRDLAQEKKVRHVAAAIEHACKYTWWESECLVRAIAALKMLEKRGVDSTLYMGTARNEAGGMKAHAWLRSGAIIVTGAKTMEQYTVVAMFGNQGANVREIHGS